MLAFANVLAALSLVAMLVCATQYIALRSILKHIDSVAARLGPVRTTRARTLAGRVRERLAAISAQLGTMDHRLAHQHQLTGLPTREPLLARIGEDGGAGLLGVVELADFGRLTAFDGSLADRVLIALTDRIVRMVGPSRTVAQVDRAAVAIWFGTATTIEAAHAELDAIAYALADRMEVDGRELMPVLRIGAAALPRDAATPDALLTRAIAALALVTPGAQAAPLAADPTANARHDFRLEQELRQAVARDQLQLLFQPLVDAAHGAVCGAEALLRWHHPELGHIQPSQFVPVLERAGLADEFGLWTLNAACREARGWQRSGLGALHVAVNLSGHQLHRADLQAMIERTLKRHRLAPSSLEIELTETVATHDVPSTRALFDALRKIGVAIAIDDFGTGYSSLSYLKKLQFDKLKIDREFVTDVDTRRDSQAICQSVIALGRGLGIRVLAEGVERHEEYAWLRRHGCTLFQGFYFARPLPAADFTAFVRDTARIDRLTGLAAGALQTRLQEKIAS